MPNTAPDTGSMLGRWDGWYANVTAADQGAFRYGDTQTYQMAARFLADCRTVEDWGCGLGGFQRFYNGTYVGLDGSPTPFVDHVVDLRTYRSHVDGIVIRHVLEHNYEWHAILTGAVASFTHKLCLILFTPFADTTHEIEHNRRHGVDAPDLSFARADIEACFVDCTWYADVDLPTATGYGVEHIYCLTRNGGPLPPE